MSHSSTNPKALQTSPAQDFVAAMPIVIFAKAIAEALKGSKPSTAAAALQPSSR